MFGRSKGIIGLDIGSHAVKLVAMKAQRGGNPYQLTHFGVAELPSESIVEGAVVRPGDVAQAIRDLLNNNKIKGSRIATAVSGHAVIVRRVTMPRMDEDELRESIVWEAEEYIPFDVDDVNLDFAILDENDDANEMDVVLVAAKRDRIEEFIAVIEEAGRDPVVVDVDAFALQNAFELSYPERQHEDVALLNMGASVINVAVLEEGRPVFWRDITLGVRQYVAALQREFMLDYFDAEEVLRRAGSGAGRDAQQLDNELGGWDDDEDEYSYDDAGEDTIPETTAPDFDTSGGAGMGGIRDASRDPRVQEVVGDVSERLITEIKKTFDFYHAQSMRERFDAIFLAGGGAHVADLTLRLEQRLGTPVELLDPLRRVTIPTKSFDPEYVRSIAPQAAVAVGLAMRGDG
ncbi:MAG: type IV pilus assembly protein PilM [Acidobacteriota bacterium]|jgi:type IV pilus assembly protein PilM